MKAAALLALAATGCAGFDSGSFDPPPGPDASIEPPSDAPGGCQVSLAYSPEFPVAGSS